MHALRPYQIRQTGRLFRIGAGPDTIRFNFPIGIKLFHNLTD